jgi:FAD/FMN-containing dehydrogenase
VPYKTIQTLLESLGYVPGMLQYWKSSFVRDFSDASIETLIDAFPSCPSPLSVIAIEHLGGAISRIADQKTAFSHRRAQHSFLIFSVWTDPKDTETNIQWSRHFYAAMQPFLEDGAYVNYLGEGEGDARVRSAYGVNYERLVAVKTKYDPRNVFRMNQNIRPATALGV